MKVYMPHQNLGCFGVEVGPYYIDVFKSPYWGLFFRQRDTTGTYLIFRRLYKLPSFKLIKKEP